MWWQQNMTMVMYSTPHRQLNPRLLTTHECTVSAHKLPTLYSHGDYELSQMWVLAGVHTYLPVWVHFGNRHAHQQSDLSRYIMHKEEQHWYTKSELKPDAMEWISLETASMYKKWVETRRYVCVCMQKQPRYVHMYFKCSYRWLASLLGLFLSDLLWCWNFVVYPARVHYFDHPMILHPGWKGSSNCVVFAGAQLLPRFACSIQPNAVDHTQLWRFLHCTTVAPVNTLACSSPVADGSIARELELPSCSVCRRSYCWLGRNLRFGAVLRGITAL